MNRFSFSGCRSGAASLALAFCLALPIAFSSVGCGGSAGSASSGNTSPAIQGQGRATFSVRWPDRDGRLIPLLANSIVIVVRSADGKVVGNVTLNRPDGSGAALSNTAAIDPVPAGEVMVIATAYPERDGTGVAQATATAPTTIRAGSNTEISMVLQSTVDRLEATATSTSVGVAYTTQIAVTGRDTAGNIVLTSPSKLRYALSDPAIAYVDPATGILTGNTVGNAQVTVTEEESGKSATVSLKVTRSAPYRLQWIEPLPNSPYVVPEGVNAKGEVVGVCRTGPSSGKVTGFYWKPGIDGRDGQTIAIEPPPGFSVLYPYAINDRGQVVGVTISFTDAPGVYAFLWENGKTTILPAPFPDMDYQARDINKSGEIAGTTFVNIPGETVADIPCIWRNGTPFPAIRPGVPLVGGKADAINDNGVFVYGGNNVEPTTPYIRFWAPDFSSTKISLPEDKSPLFVKDINNYGQVVGSYNITSQRVGRGFVLSHGLFTEVAPLPNLNQYDTILEAIANDGTAVGTSGRNSLSGSPLTPQSNLNAIRWRYGKTEDLNALLPGNTPTPFRLQEAKATSGSGIIAGSGFKGDLSKGFVLIPQGGTGNTNVGVN